MAQQNYRLSVLFMAVLISVQYGDACKLWKKICLDPCCVPPAPPCCLPLCALQAPPPPPCSLPLPFCQCPLQLNPCSGLNLGCSNCYLPPSLPLPSPCSC